MIRIEKILGTALRREAWELYRRRFEGLNEFTVQRHLMTEIEFDEVMELPTIDKHLWLDRQGVIRGLATFTRHLDAATTPLISAAYFARRWPEHYAEGRIFYCGFVCAEAPGAYVALVTSMYRFAEERKAIIGLDLCELNDQRMASGILDQMYNLDTEVQAERVDSQHYWVYEPRAAQ